MKTVTIRFELKVDNAMTEKEIEDFVKYELGFSNSLSLTNPLCSNEMSDMIEPYSLNIQL